MSFLLCIFAENRLDMKFLKISLLSAALLMSSCASVPITGRRQIMLVPNETVLATSLNQYSSYIRKADISHDRQGTAMVKRVGRRIAAATEQYLKDNGLSERVKDFSWEFNLVKSPQLNAFCMPGGKIVVYEGILKLMNSDDELAVVLGHEVAHAVARHSNERMSQAVATQLGGVALNVALNEKSAETRLLGNLVYGLGAKVGIMLPYSRKHESEADYMGMILMTIAGYDPHAAAEFWKKMAAQNKGRKPAEFLSTHPSDSKRVRALEKNLPKALKYRKTTSISNKKQAGQKGKGGSYHFNF